MDFQYYDVEITFTTPVLGSQPQRDIATEYLAKRLIEAGEGVGLPDDEVATLDEDLEKGTTAFHKRDGCPILFDYQVKGFLKEAGLTFNGLHGVKALRSKVEKFVFVQPREIPLVVPEGGGITYLERPLRAQTAMGPRVAIARSEQLPAGTRFSVRLKVYESQITAEILRDLLSYGADQGLGQWRSGGHGRFEFTLR